MHIRRLWRVRCGWGMVGEGMLIESGSFARSKRNASDKAGPQLSNRPRRACPNRLGPGGSAFLCHIGFSIPGGGIAGVGVWRLLAVFPDPRPLFIILPSTVTSSHASENISSSIPS